jgi:L-lactate dehydrogenase complex protein LldE
MTDQGEQLLHRIQGLDYRPLAKLDQCCGFGGAFAFRFGQVSAALVADKVDYIAATKARTVVATDAGCAMNIAGECKRRGLDVRVRHIADLLDEAMSNGKAPEGMGA